MLHLKIVIGRLVEAKKIIVTYFQFDLPPPPPSYNIHNVRHEILMSYKHIRRHNNIRAVVQRKNVYGNIIGRITNDLKKIYQLNMRDSAYAVPANKNSTPEVST